MAKILLVEDDKSLREIYGVRLMAEGYTITSAGDGEEALAVAIKERPDLIVSDVMMPKISGFDMLDILRSTTETKNIKVIMMTALSSEDQRARGEALGADRYLVKSQVGIEDVVRTVHDVLGDGIAPATAAPAFPPAAAPAATPAPTDVTPSPVPAPTPVIAAPVEAEPVTAPAPAPYEQPAPQPVAAPAPYVEPVAPAPIATPAAFAPPVTATPAPIATPPVFAPQPVAPVNPVFSAPTPAPAAFAPTPTPLPQPTAPFSSDPPASLGDRIINPLPSADSLGQPGVADIASQMNQELNAHIQALNPEPVAPAPAPQPYAQPPQPPIPPLPTQPGV
jgi:CheY-like chemotaxis protein